MECVNKEVCKGQLLVKKYENIQIDECNTCHGVWLDAPELFQIISKREETFSQAETKNVLQESGSKKIITKRQLSCLKCGESLVHFNYDYSSGVIIEACPKQHGFWLDKGELEKVQIHAEHWETEITKRKSELKTKMNQIEIDEVRKEMLKDASLSEKSYLLFEKIKNFLF